MTQPTRIVHASIEGPAKTARRTAQVRGAPVVATEPAGDSSEAVATTAFVTGAVGDAGEGYQPHAATLDALAATEQGAFGVSLLGVADAEAGRTALGVYATTQTDSAISAAIGAAAVQYAPAAAALPAGGAAGAVLKKASGADLDTTWTPLGTAAMADLGVSGAVVPLLSTANTWTGPQTAPAINLDGPSGQARATYWRTDGTIRWNLAADTTAETGSNAGSVLRLWAHGDDGAVLGQVLSAPRATRVVSFDQAPSWPTPATGTLTTTGATTAWVANYVTAQRGAANGLAPLDGGGKVPAANLPAVAITDTFVAASQAEMLALAAQRGDLAVRSDLSRTFALAADDPAVLANWVELRTPTDAVSSVAGRTGAVALSTSDIAGLGTAATQNTGVSGAAVPLLNGVNTWSGSQAWTAITATFGADTGASQSIVVNGAAASARQLVFRTAGLNRWALVGANSTAESGSNSGSSFVINAYDDAGALLGSALTIARSNQVATFTQSPTAPTPAAGDNSTKVATTAMLARDFQPLKPDLTSLAGASATGAMYYRSAAATWAPVTVGAGVSFSGGTLSATGAGGTVTSVGMASTDFAVSGSPVTGAGVITANLNGQAGITAGSFGGPGQSLTASVNSKGILTGLSAQPVAIGWSQITSGAPTTLAGYGITDAVSATTTRAANTVLAGPGAGTAAAPSFRPLTAADIPDLSGSYQLADPTLAALSLLNTAADQVTYWSGSDAPQQTALTGFGRSLIDDADAATARATLNVDRRTVVGDTDFLINFTDRVVAAVVPLTASRTWTLPSANSVNAGQSVTIDTGSAVANFGIFISRRNADLINAGGSPVKLSSCRAQATFVSDGATNWTFDLHAVSGISLNTNSPASANSTQNIIAGTRILAQPITRNVNVALSTSQVVGLSVGDIIEYRRTGSDTFVASVQNGSGTTLAPALVNRTYRFLFSGSDWIFWGSTAD